MSKRTPDAVVIETLKLRFKDPQNRHERFYCSSLLFQLTQ